MLGVDGDRSLVAVEHREIEAVGAFDVAQLSAGDIAHPRPLHLDDVGAHIGEELGAGRPRLHMGEVEDAHAVERLAGLAPGFRRGLRQAIGGRRPFCLGDGFRRRPLCLQLDDPVRRRPGFGPDFCLGLYLALRHRRFLYNETRSFVSRHSRA